jgi:hypothetical protein
LAETDRAPAAQPVAVPARQAPAPVRPSRKIEPAPADPEPENQERLVLIAFVAMTIFAGLFLGVFAYISSGVSGD